MLYAVDGYQMAKGTCIYSLYCMKTFTHNYNNCVLLDWIKFLLTLSFLHSVWVQLLDRSQQRLVLILIPLSLFIPVKKDNSMDYDGFHDPSESMQILIDESCEVWINVSTGFFACLV